MLKFSLAFASAVLLLSTSALASSTVSVRGIPIEVISSADGIVQFRLDKQPSDHPICTHAYFAIASENEKAVDRMYARLLASFTQKQSISVSYDDSASSADVCSSGYIKVYRLG